MLLPVSLRRPGSQPTRSRNVCEEFPTPRAELHGSESDLTSAQGDEHEGPKRREAGLRCASLERPVPATYVFVFCGHGASCLGIVRAFGGSGYVGYVSLSHFRRESGGWRQVGELGDTSHLPPELARQSRESAF